MSTPLDQLFTKTRSENRAALIAYIPAGYPTQEGCKAVIDAFADAGVDAIEIGFPYSDPVMDGPTTRKPQMLLSTLVLGQKKFLKHSHMQLLEEYQVLL